MTVQQFPETVARLRAEMQQAALAAAVLQAWATPFVAWVLWWRLLTAETPGELEATRAAFRDLQMGGVG